MMMFLLNVIDADDDLLRLPSFKALIFQYLVQLICNQLYYVDFPIVEQSMDINFLLISSGFKDLPSK